MGQRQQIGFWEAELTRTLKFNLVGQAVSLLMSVSIVLWRTVRSGLDSNVNIVLWETIYVSMVVTVTPTRNYILDLPL